MTCCPPNSSSDRSSSLCNATSSDPIITAEQTTRSTLISPIPTTVHSRATLTMIYLVIHPILIHSRLHLLWLLALEHPPTPCLLAHGHEKVPKRRKGQGEMIYPKLKLITNLKVSKGRGLLAAPTIAIGRIGKGGSGRQFGDWVVDGASLFAPLNAFGLIRA